jgi:hypothetical protein
MVREYEALKEIHVRYIELAKLNQEDGDKEYKWASEVTEKQRKALEDVQKYLNLHLPKPEGSVRSSASSRSSTREKLQEAERLQKETELKIQQQRAEATERAAEEERMQQLETARKAEEIRIEAARKDRQLQMELEKQRLSSDLLRQQLADENAVDGDEMGKTADQGAFSIWEDFPPAPQIPGGPAPTSRSLSGKNGPAWPQQRSSTPLPPLNVNTPPFVPNTSCSQAQRKQDGFGAAVPQTFPSTLPRIPTSGQNIPAAVVFVPAAAVPAEVIFVPAAAVPAEVIFVSAAAVPAAVVPAAAIFVPAAAVPAAVIFVPAAAVPAAAVPAAAIFFPATAIHVPAECRASTGRVCPRRVDLHRRSTRLAADISSVI